MDKVISYTNVRENLAQIMTEVCEDHIVAHITRRNGQNCVLISEEEYDSIRESLYLFGNPANAAVPPASTMRSTRLNSLPA